MKKTNNPFSLLLSQNCFSLALPSLLLLFLLASCKNGAVFTPVSSGRPYEMLVVMDNAAWEAPEGRALFDVLDTDVPGLPQSERSFRISHIDPPHFDRVMRVFRNIIIPDIKPTYTQTKFKYERDAYAQPQVIMTIQSPSAREFEEYVSAHGQTIIDFFTRCEMQRQVKELKRSHSELVAHKVDSIFGCQLHVPVEIGSYKAGDNFLWASSNTATNNINVVVYSFPYRDPATFTYEHFLHKRDSVKEKYLIGSRDGLYVYTDTILLDVKPITVHGKYALEARGLWAMKNDIMGGPFVSHTRLDTDNQRIVVVEGFVFSPDKLKRNLMRMMEASLYTLLLPEERNFSED